MKETALPYRAALMLLGGSHATLFRLGVVALLSVATESSSASAAFDKTQRRAKANDVLTLVGPRIPSPTDWWLAGVGRGRFFRLESVGSRGAETRQPHVLPEHFPWGAKSAGLRARPRDYAYSWHVDFNETPALVGEGKLPDWLDRAQLRTLTVPARPRLNPFETLRGAPTLGLTALLEAPRPFAAPVTLDAPCASWREPRAVSFEGLGGEGARLALVDCDGAVTQQAIEQLSVLGREPGTPAPSLPLPLEPLSDPPVADEWVTGVHLLHPRLLAHLQRIALAFPARSIVLYSAYRRDGRVDSPHRKGRAVDIEVKGIPKESLFALCRTLNDAGCGYYPHQPFVHVDVRSPIEGSVYWVDASEPGHPSIYVESWPGVVTRGAAQAPGAD